MHPGTLLGKFKLDSLLGAGGMGEVWKARDTELGRWVAIKFVKGLDAGSGSDPSSQDDLVRFLREAQTAGRLDHPNIAAIYETGQDPPYIAMQLIDGVTLRKAGIKDPREVARLMRDAARAVAHAHEHGVIHRDLKPDNFMVSDGRIFVMDFGLARTIESNQTASGFVVGTPAYMPPEQAKGEKIDERADVYALGATLYELLTGRAPFTGSTFTVLVSVVTEDPVAPASINPSLADDLQTIIAKCMEKDRNRRYPTAAAVADELDRWLAGEPIEARPVSTVTRIGRKLRRRSPLVVAILVVALTPLVLLPLLMRRTTDVTRAQVGVVERMRTTSETCLQSALDLRRAGNLDGMERYSKELEGACRDVMRELPQSGEPYQLFGRMLRAQGLEADALAQQDEALRREPALAPARYERVVLLSRLYRERREQAVAEAKRLVSMQLAALEGGMRAGLVKESVKWQEVVANDAQSRDLLHRLEEDLARIGTTLGAAELACAEGLRAWIKEQYDEARRRFREAIEKAPRLEEAYEALGTLETEYGRYEEAVKWWTAGIDQDRGAVNQHLGRARTYVNWAVVAWRDPARQTALFDMAGRDFDAATALAPRSADAWLRRGRALVVRSVVRRGVSTESILRDAIESFSRVIALDPGNAEGWMQRGGARVNVAGERQGRGEEIGTYYEEALADFKEALRINDTLADAWAWRGNAHSNMAQVKSGAEAVRIRTLALADLDEALKRDADRFHLWLHRASTRAEQALDLETTSPEEATQFFDLALADYGEVLRRWPRNAEAWILRGRAHANIARRTRREMRDPTAPLEAALADLTKGVALAPVYSDAWEGRGAVRMEMALHAGRTGRDIEPILKQALADFDEALKQNASNAAALLGRGTARGNLAELAAARGRDASAEFRAAIADCTASLAAKANNAEAFAQRAALRANLAKQRVRADAAESEELYRTAVDDFKQAGVLNPARADTWIDLAIARFNWAQLQLSRREDPTPMMQEAIEDAGTAIEKDKRASRAFQIRAGVHEELSRLLVTHQPEKAAKEFELAIADFSAAIDLDPGDGDGWRRRGAARVNRAGRMTEDPRKLIEAAIVDFDRAIQINKRDALSFWFRGNARGVRGRWRISIGEDPADDARQILKDYDEAVRLNAALEPRLRANREFWMKRAER